MTIHHKETTQIANQTLDFMFNMYDTEENRETQNTHNKKATSRNFRLYKLFNIVMKLYRISEFNKVTNYNTTLRHSYMLIE